MKSTILKLIAPLGAVLLVILNDLGYSVTTEQMDTVIAAVAIVITAISPALREKK
jgi:hypothetical protein